MSDQRGEQRGHFGSSPAAEQASAVSFSAGGMPVPAWAQERAPAGGKPLTVFDPPGGRGRSDDQGRGPSAKRVDTSPRRDRAKLGRTSGLFAAWGMVREGGDRTYD